MGKFTGPTLNLLVRRVRYRGLGLYGAWTEEGEATFPGAFRLNTYEGAWGVRIVTPGVMPTDLWSTGQLLTEASVDLRWCAQYEWPPVSTTPFVVRYFQDLVEIPTGSGRWYQTGVSDIARLGYEGQFKVTAVAYRFNKLPTSSSQNPTEPLWALPNPTPPPEPGGE